MYSELNNDKDNGVPTFSLFINSFAREKEAKSPKASCNVSILFIIILKLNKTNSRNYKQYVSNIKTNKS